MPTTSNFGWNTPADTDLVKDGALAIRTLGNNIDASMADLKGGTTGQVLSKNSNTDMDFTWVTSDDANAIQNAIVDAKGDLITATAADTPARLAVGSNGDTLVADSAASVGLRYQSAYNGNAIINGSMDAWQRGTSFVGTGYNYTADRWMIFRGSFAAGMTASRQTGPEGFQYALRLARDSGNTGTQSLEVRYALETVDSLRFQNQAITFSFWARAGANFSPGTFAAQVWSGTGTDQATTGVQGGWTGASVRVNATVTPTTSWVRYQYTGTIPASATQVGLAFGWVPTGTAGANDWIEITGVQLELGSVATTFKRAGNGTIQGELAACQRYYYRIRGDEGSAGTTNAIGLGTYYNASVFRVPLRYPVKMRRTPDYSSANATNYFLILGNNTSVNYSTTTLDFATPDVAIINVATSGGTTGQSAWIQTTNASAFVDFSAEL